jgi:hypothetical protein
MMTVPEICITPPPSKPLPAIPTQTVQKKESADLDDVAEASLRMVASTAVRAKASVVRVDPKRLP